MKRQAESSRSLKFFTLKMLALREIKNGSVG